MRLGEKQEIFSMNFALLIMFAYNNGYRIRMGDVLANNGHKANSNHYIKLAGDLNLFKDGKYLTQTEDHRQLGEFWESLHPMNRWGGRFNDGNHYSMLHNGRM